MTAWLKKKTVMRKQACELRGREELSVQSLKRELQATVCTAGCNLFRQNVEHGFAARAVLADQRDGER